MRTQRRRVRPKPSTLPWLGGVNISVDFDDISRALKVSPKQVKEANEASQSMGCGTPFRSDGMFVAGRKNKARYMREINKRADDKGQKKLVNFDGGYSDVI